MRDNQVNLSPAARRVLAHTITGQSQKEIAGNMHCSVETVKWYERTIHRSLGVHTKAEILARLVGLLACGKAVPLDFGGALALAKALEERAAHPAEFQPALASAARIGGPVA